MDGNVPVNVPHKRVIHQYNIKLAQEHADTLLVSVFFLRVERGHVDQKPSYTASF